ncbi:MAG: hypothetical protein Q9186_005757 [Xanthomendoza sp. 1 TL-2023]
MMTWNDFDGFLHDDFPEISYEAAMHQAQNLSSDGHAWSFPTFGGLPFADDHTATDFSMGEFAQTGHWSPFDQQEQAAIHAQHTPEIHDDLYLRMKQAFESQEGEHGSLSVPEQQSSVGAYGSEIQGGHVPTLSKYTPLAELALTQDNAGNLVNQTESISKYRPKRDKSRAKRSYKGVEQKKARVQKRNDVLCIIMDGHWYPAVYHHEIRAEIIEENPPERYTHQPEKGDTVLDVTSFWMPHRDWGFAARQDRPTVLQEWQPRITAMGVPDLWKHNDNIVLDSGGIPIRDWPIPGCLSSQVEAGRCEAIIRESGHIITNHDLIVRMPWIHGSDGIWRPPIKDGGLSMRRNRFRDLSGLPSNNPRQGSTEKKLALIQLIPAVVMEDILLTNSTQGFRDLTKDEMKFLQMSTRGLHPEKAGSKLLDPEERKKAKQSKEKSLNNFRPVNPTSEPFGNDPDDRRALDRVRRRRGLAHLNASENGILHQGRHEHLPGSPSPYLGHSSASSQTLGRWDTSDYGTPEARSEIRDIGQKRGRGEECGNSEDPAGASKKRRHGVSLDSEHFHTFEGLEFVSDLSLTEPNPDPQTLKKDTPYVLELIHQNDNIQLALASSNTADGLFDPGNPRRAAVTAQETPYLTNAESIETADNNSIRNLMLGPDHRFKAPSNDLEASTIARFIQYSESEAERWLDIRPPTWYGLSYMEHWDLLTVWFAGKWSTNDVPNLWRSPEPWLAWPHELYWEPSTDEA